jgi:hypothetical protein
MYRVGEVVATTLSNATTATAAIMSIPQEEESDLYYGKIVSASDKNESGLRRLKIEVKENCYQNYLSSEVLQI